MADEKPPEKKPEADGPGEKPEPQKDIFTGIAIVAGVLVALVLANVALAGVEFMGGDGVSWSGSGKGRAEAFQEAADLIGEVESHIDRVIDAERAGEAVRRTDPRCVDPAARFTAEVLAKIRAKLERKARRAADDGSESKRRGCRRRDGVGKCDRRGDEDYPDALK